MSSQHQTYSQGGRKIIFQIQFLNLLLKKVIRKKPKNEIEEI